MTKATATKKPTAKKAVVNESEDVSEDENGRTRVIILETAICDTELGSFKAGDQYPCDEATAKRMIERKMAKASK